MPLKFSLTSGEELPMQIGLPPKYNGPILRGADVHFITHPNVSIMVQQHQSRHMGISLTKITWKKPERIICEVDHTPVLFVRTLYNHFLCEVIKALGEIKLDDNHFYALAGSKWRSVLVPGKAGEYFLLDLFWNIENPNDPILGIEPFCFSQGLPQRLMDLTCRNNPLLQIAFHDLMNVDYSYYSQRIAYHELMGKCLMHVRGSIAESTCIKTTMKESEWHYVEQAKKVLHENLGARISTPDISVKIGVNEFKLKKLFKKATGYSIDEYRKYRLFTSAARTLAQSPGMVLKSMSENTGYENEASMLRAFKSAMYCTPGEIKSDGWDLSRLNSIPESKWK